MTAEATPNTELGGYDYAFVDAPPDKIICKICHHPSREPDITDCCGAIYCKSCLEKAKQSTTVSTACAVCREENFKSLINT